MGRKKLDPGALLEIFRKEYEILSPVQSVADFENRRDKKRCPSVRTYTNYFGSWNETLKAAGIAKKYKRHSLDVEILKLFKAEYERLLPVKGVDDFRERYDNTKCPSPTTIMRRYGSWGEAKKAAGIKTILCKCGAKFESKKSSAIYCPACRAEKRNAFSRKYRGNKNESSDNESLIGQKFGRLKVIEDTGKRDNKRRIWFCRCDCGNTSEASTTNLKTGNTRSCGCLRKEMSSAYSRKRMVDLTGKNFGSLTVLRKSENQILGSPMWVCECKCGNICEVSSSHLTTGNTKSCGCLFTEMLGKSFEVGLKFIDGTEITKLKSNTIPKNNKTGVVGVSLCKDGKYRAEIGFKKKTYYLGLYDNLEDAARVRQKAKEKIHGGFVKWYYENFPHEPND